jgi:hypothetical protein
MFSIALQLLGIELINLFKNDSNCCATRFPFDIKVVATVRDYLPLPYFNKATYLGNIIGCFLNLLNQKPFKFNI